MSKSERFLAGLLLFFFGVLVGVVWQLNVAWAGGQDMVSGRLLGGMMGHDGSVVVLRGEALGNGEVQVFLDYEGGGSFYSELLAQVPGPVEGGLLMGCGDQAWVVVQASGRVYRWWGRRGCAGCSGRCLCRWWGGSDQGAVFSVQCSVDSKKPSSGRAF